MRRLGQVLAGSDAEAKRARHRKWLWCRRENGFSDNPLFRAAARIAGVPLPYLQAFANRLEELANKSDPRGYVGDFNPAEFAEAMAIEAEVAARMFAALEHPDVRWVDQEHVASFYARNRDEEDATAALRARRAYARRMLRKALAKLAAQGVVAAAERDAVEADLDHMADEELFELDRRRKIGQLGGAVKLSTSHGVSHRESVRSHARAEHSFSLGAVDNSGDTARGAAAGSAKEGAGDSAAPPQDAAEQWVAVHGLRVVTERMALLPSLAATRIERWKRELAGNAEALAAIIDAADHANLVGAAFHVAVTDQITRRLRAESGPQLPLLHVKRGGAA